VEQGDAGVQGSVGEAVQIKLAFCPWLKQLGEAGSYKYAKSNYEFFKGEGHPVKLCHSGNWWYVKWLDAKE
jgi:hypothetical protein